MNVSGSIYSADSTARDAGGAGSYLAPPPNSKFKFGNLEFPSIKLADPGAAGAKALQPGSSFQYQGRVELRFGRDGERYLQALDVDPKPAAKR